MSIDLQPGFVLIIPRDEADQHALTAALHEARENSEVIGQTTATPVLSFIVTQALADRIGRGADPAPVPVVEGDPDAPEQSGQVPDPDQDGTEEDGTDEDEQPEDEPQSSQESASAEESDGSEGGAVKRPRSRGRTAKSTETTIPEADPAQAGTETQEG